MTAEETPALKVDTHVLVQLGSELVTDAEQAILECVKNAYDADSAGCRIEIVTRDEGTVEDEGPAERLRPFAVPCESVEAGLFDAGGLPLHGDGAAVADDAIVKRRLRWTGRITIADTGEGMDERQLRESWLVVSRSSKRVEDGKKAQTGRSRTPLGDKGLGRLGTMKLGDILSVESAPQGADTIGTARFRWADCAVAQTVDRIPVFVGSRPNDEGFKGTRVSILGLKEIDGWRRKGRMVELAGRLTRLISPFETTSRFRVGLSFDGDEHSLAAVTQELLERCIARFDFQWSSEGGGTLKATARFRRRLFSPTRSGKARDKAMKALLPDEGLGFHRSLKGFKRLTAYEVSPITPDQRWFIELSATMPAEAIMPRDAVETIDPGPFSGSFYYFHLDSLDDDPHAAPLQGVDGRAIKEMAGISILREGFRVRSQGDWLELAAGMTSGSTYQLRVNNTVGYFALTGRENHRLVEKSDREGFVENAAYRGFFAIARSCRKFANDSLEDVRRAFDAYYKTLAEDEGAPPTAEASLALVERHSRASLKARTDAVAAADVLRGEIETLEVGAAAGEAPAIRAVAAVKRAVTSIEGIARGFDTVPMPTHALDRVRQEIEENREQAAALFESAALGLSARGMAHELRTHLAEIRTRTAQIDRISKNGPGSPAISGHLRAIKGACIEIQKAAALIDPMLPRSRAEKESFALLQFVSAYREGRYESFERNGIDVRIVKDGEPGEVRTTRPRLLQALDNLVRNSVYWVTRPDVSGADGLRWIEIKVARGSIEVSDSGPGVDPRFEESLFEIFVSGRPPSDGGQGLGLYITRSLLEAMGCGIELLPARNGDGRRNRFEMDLRGIAIGPA